MGSGDWKKRPRLQLERSRKSMRMGFRIIYSLIAIHICSFRVLRAPSSPSPPRPPSSTCFVGDLPVTDFAGRSLFANRRVADVTPLHQFFIFLRAGREGERDRSFGFHILQLN